jgi:glycine cleavage system regulatory protein
MTSTAVFTFVGLDQPGLVQKLAQSVNQHGGNWLESRMSELAGQFAGIVQVEVSDAQFPALRAALVNLSSDDFSVVVASSSHAGGKDGSRHLRLSIVGNDRPGIVREVASALAARNISVSEMDTHVSSAPMSGDQLFEAVARIKVPQALDLAELQAQLHAIGDALTVEIDLEEAPPQP